MKAIKIIMTIIGVVHLTPVFAVLWSGFINGEWPVKVTIDSALLMFFISMIIFLGLFINEKGDQF